MGLLGLVPFASIQHAGAGGPYFWGYSAFAGVMHLFEQYLEVRQLRRNKDPTLPADVKTLGVTEESFSSTQRYQVDKRTWGMIKSWLSFGWNMTMIAVVYPRLWHFSEAQFGAGHEYKTTLLWLFLQAWIDKPMSIAFSLYDNFVIEERHGFNKMTMGLFVTDMLKSEALQYVFVGPLVPAIIWIVRWGGKQFYLYVWAFLQALIFVFLWLYPNIIQPLFNKYTELKDEELKKKIEAMAASEDFPLKKLFEVDGSKRSSHSNAYFYGFGSNKRIVIYDTLLTLTHDQVLAVLLHELGHWKFSHTLTNLVITSAHLFMILWLYGVVMYSPTGAQILNDLGYGQVDSVIISLTSFTMLLTPVEEVIGQLMTLKSRRNEFQADTFAAARGRSKELGEGLLHISQENKGDLNPDPMYSWFHHSHPPVVERLRALNFFDKTETKKTK